MVYNLHMYGNASSYAAARQLYESAKPWKHGSSERKLNPKSSRDIMGVRMSGLDVVFRLYGTDCVTWHPDNTFTIDPYASLTTSRFVKRYTPSYCWAWFTDERGMIFEVGDPMCKTVEPAEWGYGDYSQTRRVYELASSGPRARFKHDPDLYMWVPYGPEGFEKIKIPNIDRKKSNRLRGEWVLRLRELVAGSDLCSPQKPSLRPVPWTLGRAVRLICRSSTDRLLSGLRVSSRP